MKTAFFILVILHGLIHVIGFVKGYELREIKEFTLPISKPMGIAWLITCLFFLGYGLLFSISHRYAWVVGLAAVVLSQILIFLVWKDAKFGTLPNILILLVTLVSMGQFFFEKRVQEETDALLSQVNPSPTQPITEDELRDLPEPVKKWLHRSGMVGRPRLTVGKVTQKAEMKLKPDQENWFPAKAVQYTRMDVPGFIWTVDVKMNPLVFFRGRDKFAEGQGQMLILLEALFPIVNASGEKLDEGSLQRYLGELVWFPSFALSKDITWEQLSDTSAKATLQVGDTRGSGTFYFTPEGDFSRFSALRYQGNEADAKRQEWVIQATQLGEMDGIRIPTQMTATWKLDQGDWTWLKLQVTDIQYNEQALRDRKPAD
ncbi:hypothetical protein D0X99_06700 [Algoriphagus lacus]|uniref:Uncharacterized protein n=1 Tax=Algoriphagus lacus TaxID=2056311 RepID=A0A418PUZ5_9BACT|nr:DUF6544 family protein [Algoriphagus lacus]RIW17411.1 hypothetical protein D0X99_06700 [Algoriphagus lacus]